MMKLDQAEYIAQQLWSHFDQSVVQEMAGSYRSVRPTMLLVERTTLSQAIPY